MIEKRFNVFDVDGTVFLEDHKEGSYHIGEKENVDIPCLNDIADRLNTYADENEQLKQDRNALIHLLENQSMIIEELHSKLLEYQLKEPIVLTKEDLNLMVKAIYYYTHGRYLE